LVERQSGDDILGMYDHGDAILPNRHTPQWTVGRQMVADKIRHFTIEQAFQHRAIVAGARFKGQLQVSVQAAIGTGQIVDQGQRRGIGRMRSSACVNIRTSSIGRGAGFGACSCATAVVARQINKVPEPQAESRWRVI
jgi:hypothetical protein